MATLTSTNVRRALVRTVRAAPVYGSLRGIFRGFAPEKVDYPFAVYSTVTSVNEDDWTNRMMIGAYDVVVYSRDEAEASNFDQAIADALDGAQLTVDGMSSLICRRVSDIPMDPDLDERGDQIYGSGGSYEIWTDQPLS